MYFVTGANGLVGCHVVSQLLMDTSKVICCGVRSEKSKQQLLYDLSKISKLSKSELEKRLTFSLGDILDSTYLENNLNEKSVVIHTAACVSFDLRDRDLLFETNIIGTENVVNACLFKRVKKLCYISSVAAIGRAGEAQQTTELTEWENSNNNTNYAISKYYAELEVWRGSEEGLETVIVNPTVVLGYTSQGNSSSSIFHNIKKGFPFKSKGINGFVSANDVARAVDVLVHSDIKSERFVLCSENMDFDTLFTSIAFALGKKPPQITVKPWMKFITLPLAWIISKLSGKAPFVTKEVFNTSMGINKYSAQKIERAIGFQFTPIAQVVENVGHIMS